MRILPYYPIERALDWYLLYITIRHRSWSYSMVRNVFDKERGKTCCKVDYMFAQLLFVQKKVLRMRLIKFRNRWTCTIFIQTTTMLTQSITKLAKVSDHRIVHKRCVVFGLSVLIQRQNRSALDQTTNHWFWLGNFLKFRFYSMNSRFISGAFKWILPLLPNITVSKISSK